MVLAQGVKTRDSACSFYEAADFLSQKLDEAIDDMENGRVQTIEDAWEEIDAI